MQTTEQLTQEAEAGEAMTKLALELKRAEQALTRSGFTRNGNDWEPPVHGPSYHLMTYWRSVAMNKQPDNLPRNAPAPKCMMTVAGGEQINVLAKPDPAHAVKIEWPSPTAEEMRAIRDQMIDDVFIATSPCGDMLEPGAGYAEEHDDRDFVMFLHSDPVETINREMVEIKAGARKSPWVNYTPQVPGIADQWTPEQMEQIKDRVAEPYQIPRIPIKMPNAIWPVPGKMEFNLERRDRDPMNMANRDDALKMPEDPVLPEDE